MSISRPSLTDVVIWAGAAAPGDIATPTTGQQAAGWTPTPAAPPYQWMNWIKNFLSKGVLYLMGRGISDYDATLDYGTNDTVRGADGKVYESMGFTSAGNAPPNGTYWRIFGVGWLEDALKTSLADSLPPLMAAVMHNLLGINFTYASVPTRGTFDCGGVRIAWFGVPLSTSNGYVTTTTVHWLSPFGDIFTAVATPYGPDILISIPALDATSVTLVPSGGAASGTVGVIAIGTTPA